jgi:hypothetical protein
MYLVKWIVVNNIHNSEKSVAQEAIALSNCLLTLPLA